MPGLVTFSMFSLTLIFGMISPSLIDGTQLVHTAKHRRALSW